jgi:PIN domain nuclease of toxin-antitoxin system
LIDTHLLLWGAREPHRIAPRTRNLLTDPANQLFFSSISIWEIAIKQALGKPDFDVKSDAILRGLLGNLYIEVPLTSVHGVAVESLPRIYHDLFDRILIAQATVEALTLLTPESRIAEYPGPILKA